MGIDRGAVDAVRHVSPGEGFDFIILMAGLISGDWPAAVQMLDDGLASVIIVSTPAHLEQAQGAAPRGESRVEIVPKRLNRRRPSTRPVARMATLT